MPIGEVETWFPIGEKNAPVQVTETGKPERGQEVFKFGKTTGRKTGTIVDVDATILVDYSFGTFRFVDQVLIEGETEDFAGDGDSGAVVVTRKDGKHVAVAMVFAPMGKFTAACPLDVVLQDLGEELKALGKDGKTTLTLAGYEPLAQKAGLA